MDKRLPKSVHFIAVNIAALDATGEVDKEVIVINLTEEQIFELSSKTNSGQHFFDCIIAY